MTKTKHKILSVFLSMCMIVSCMVGMRLTASAEPYTGEVIVTNSVTEIIQSGSTQTTVNHFDRQKKSLPCTYTFDKIKIVDLYGCDYISASLIDGSNVTVDDSAKTVTINDLGTSTVEIVYESSNHDGTTFTFNCVINVTAPVTSVSLDKTTATLTAGGDAVALTATVAPENATDKKVKWSVVGAAVELYSDAECTTEIGADATDVLTVYAKGIAGGYEAEVNVTSNADSTKSATCAVTVDKATPTADHFSFTAPSNLNFDGTAKTATVVPASGVTGMGEVTVKYYSDAACTTEVQNTSNTGTYYVGITVDEGDSYNATTSVLHGSSWQFTIGKASATVTKAPEPKTLTYNGQAQVLVTAGEATGGEMQYALGENATTAPADDLYDISIPTATDAGTYYVWYKVIGDKNHLDTEAESIEVKIDKAKGDTDPNDIFYINVEGAGGEWTKGSGDSLQMTFKRSVVDSETFSHFTGILVDGKAVDASDYTAESGSVIIKLNPSFLETLTVGEHVLTAQFDDADDAEADFTVKEATESAKDADIKPADTQADTQKTAEEKIDSPKTGDETNPQLMLLIMLLAAIDMALVAFIKSKKKNNR